MDIILDIQTDFTKGSVIMNNLYILNYIVMRVARLFFFLYLFVNGKIAKFWSWKGLRQGCTLSLALCGLSSLFIEDIEMFMKKTKWIDGGG